MADSTDYQRLRQDVAATLESLPDLEAEDIFAEAAAVYPEGNSQLAYTRVIALRRLLAQAAIMTSYTQNNSREELGKVFDNYLKMLDLWTKQLAQCEEVVAGAMGAARFGKTNSKPSRLAEYPDYSNGNGTVVTYRRWGW